MEASLSEMFIITSVTGRSCLLASVTDIPSASNVFLEAPVPRETSSIAFVRNLTDFSTASISVPTCPAIYPSPESVSTAIPVRLLMSTNALPAVTVEPIRLSTARFAPQKAAATAMMLRTSGMPILSEFRIFCISRTCP